MRIQQILCSVLVMTIGMTVETYDWWSPSSFSDFAVPIGMSGLGGLAAHYGGYNPMIGTYNHWRIYRCWRQRFMALLAMEAT